MYVCTRDAYSTTNRYIKIPWHTSEAVQRIFSAQVKRCRHATSGLEATQTHNLNSNLYVYVLCVCIMCMYYVYVLCVCITCMYYVYIKSSRQTE